MKKSSAERWRGIGSLVSALILLAALLAVSGCAGTDYGGVNYLTTDGTNWKVVGGKNGENIKLKITKGADGATSVEYSADTEDAGIIQARITERLAIALSGIAGVAAAGSPAP